MFIRDITGIRHVHDTNRTWFSGTLKTCRETQPTQFTLKIIYLPELKHLNVMPSMLGILKTRKKKTPIKEQGHPRRKCCVTVHATPQQCHAML